MKNTLLLLFSLLNTFVCLSAATATISGKISNATSTEFRISNTISSQKFTLSADGSFKAVLQLQMPGKFYFTLNGAHFPIFIENGNAISFDADEKNLVQSVKYKGDNASANQYLLVKWNLQRKLYKSDLNKISEKEFLETLEKIRKTHDSLFKRFPIQNSRFTELEKRDWTYFDALKIIEYRKYHAQEANLENYVLPADFPKTDFSSMKMDSNEDAAFSGDYFFLTSHYLYSLPNLEEDEKTAHKLPFAKIRKTFKSPVIRDAIYVTYMFQLAVDNPASEAIYRELMASATDEIFRKDVSEKYEKLAGLLPGKAAPEFNFDNFAGGKTALQSLKGKYVYIDFWATWCKPCKEEIPALKSIEAKYSGRKVEFVSISLDVDKDREKWQNLVRKENLQGLQLIDGSGFDSPVAASYLITSIPRFVLIDPDGKIVNAAAPRPSDPELAKLLDSLLL